MTPHDEATLLAHVRKLVRDIQLAVYRVGISGRCHAGKAREMLDDIDKIEQSTDAVNPREHQQRLPAIIEHIERLDREAQDFWQRTRQNDSSVRRIQGELNKAYDAVSLKPRNYERLVRQSDKPLLEEAKAACQRPTGDPGRDCLEDRLRMSVDDFLELEQEITRCLAEIDRLRDSFAETYREFVNDYIRSVADGSRMSLAAGFLGMRRAVNSFDDRRGFQFVHYVTPWIDRELSRVGHEDVG